MGEYGLPLSHFKSGDVCGCADESVDCDTFAAVVYTAANGKTETIRAMIEQNINNGTFFRMDTNGDCKLTVAEIETYLQNAGGREQGLLRHFSWDNKPDGILSQSDLDALFHFGGTETKKGVTEHGCAGHHNISYDTFSTYWDPSHGENRCPVLNVYAVVPNEPATPVTPAKPTEPVTNTSQIKTLESVIAQGKNLGLDVTAQERELKRLKGKPSTATPAKPKVDVAAVTPEVKPAEAVAPKVKQPGLLLVSCGKPTYLGEIIRQGTQTRLTPGSGYGDYKPIYAYRTCLDHYERMPNAPKGFCGLTPQNFDEAKLRRIAEIESQLMSEQITGARKTELVAEQGKLISQTPILPAGTRFVVGVKEN